MTLKEFDALLKTAVPDTYHYEAHKATAHYIVWNEYRKIRSHADNRPQSGLWRVQVDYFTPHEYDDAIDALEELFADAGIPYTLKTAFETATRYVRHAFDCEVILTG